MQDWRDINLIVERKPSDKPVYSQMTEWESKRGITERLQMFFESPAHAKAEQEARGEKWSAFEKHVSAMEESYEKIGIERARLVKVDFSRIRSERDLEWARDTGELER